MFKFNYGEHIFQQLITAEFVQLKLSHILIALTANFINLNILSLLCLIVSINIYVDFFIQIVISIVMALKIGVIYNFVERYEREYFALTQYLINNYSIENYRYWKRCVIITACIYACILLTIVQINNKVLFIYIVQYAICFLVEEQFEQQRIQNWLKNYCSQPKTKLYHDLSTDFLINSYMLPQQNVLRAHTRMCVRVPTCENPVVRAREPSLYLIDNIHSGKISSGNIQPHVRQGITNSIRH